MIIAFADKAFEDYQFWKQNDETVLKRIDLILKDIQKNPKKLEKDSNGYYSRIIILEHKLIYKIFNGMIVVAQCRFR
ncbi:type II toxin-antitoxin system YoeB family toxin [Sulfurimonas sp. SAG-AH-194-I05]|nr:type II toxin-antitoxin system YoeB family toxin [Sulfurimonas sp. SAG-AH-194-I05]MDF1874297.1 type II toxin-antitoxin system YoeB family toxin [Sulfurimonas sp. SAG-AH-194-I05]